jgi:hypothetical protein
VQHRLYIFDRHLRCTQKLLKTNTLKCSTGSIYLTDTSGAHKSSCRQTRLGSALALVDRQVIRNFVIRNFVIRNFVPVPCTGTALTAVEEARPGAAKAAIDQASPSTAKAALEQTHLERQNRLLGQTRSDGAQSAVEQKNRNVQSAEEAQAAVG